jgi:hypothetical protein
MTMTTDEQSLIHSHIDASAHYLEFGSGESTIYASASSGVKTIDAVESSETFVNESLLPDTSISHALSAQKLKFHIINIGETSKWGCPKYSSTKPLWPNYSLSVFSKKSKHDLVFVDGRFRVACTLSRILNTAENCKIMIHDFWIRQEYHVLLGYLDVLGKVDTLGVFSRKKDLDIQRVQSLLKKYQYLPGDKPIFQ